MGRKKKAQDRDEYPMVFETFRDLGRHDKDRLSQDSSSCFNGQVNVNKYRVTFEKVEEPVEFVAARLQHLWDVCDNHHHWDPLKAKAKTLGYVLQGNAGRHTKKG